MRKEVTVDTQDKEFVAELHKRLQKELKETPLTYSEQGVKDFKRLTMRSIDSMINDGWIGPMFHSEIETVVDCDYSGKSPQMNISFKHIAGEEK